jgi:protein-S-isoprenylcysteine O-methyltransferase Ste14
MRQNTSWSQIARRIRVPVGFVFAVLYLWLARPVWGSLAAGGAVASAGLALRAVASGHVRKNSELATTGPYAYTRNPLYLGSLIIALGFSVAARSAWVFGLMVAIFAIIYMPVIRSEERFLETRFPEYNAYAQQVPRLGIKLTRGQKPKGRFSLELYLQHREYNALIGAALMMTALVAKAAKLHW